MNNTAQFIDNFVLKQPVGQKLFDIVCDIDTGYWSIIEANPTIAEIIPFGYYYFRGPYPENEAKRILADINSNPARYMKYIRR